DAAAATTAVEATAAMEGGPAVEATAAMEGGPAVTTRSTEVCAAPVEARSDANGAAEPGRVRARGEVNGAAAHVRGIVSAGPAVRGVAGAPGGSPAPRAVVEGSDAPGRHEPAPPERGRIEIDVRFLADHRGRRAIRHPRPAVLRRVDPLALRGHLRADLRRRGSGGGLRPRGPPGRPRPPGPLR